ADRRVAVRLDQRHRAIEPGSPGPARRDLPLQRTGLSAQGDDGMSRKTVFIALCVALVGLLVGLGFASSLVLRISTQTAFVLVGLTAILTTGGLVLIHRHVTRGAEQESEASIRGFVETAWTAIIIIDSDNLIRL